MGELATLPNTRQCTKCKEYKELSCFSYRKLNRIKSDATWKQIEMVANFYKELDK